ncbi:hypothetical protein HK097_004441 [Rhizophlyctis rosea]|uniref:Rieske domain-containing protein n=1 Tax=Rhizophlyctis rosea TaxID=64517 RepID=A0AAD5WZ19_9FUNG|nr:hypothetical protein HK097_004441 [Rhizophlyctis rosea]
MGDTTDTTSETTLANTPYTLPDPVPLGTVGASTHTHPTRPRAKSVWFSALDLSRAARAAEVDAVDNEQQVQQKARTAFFDETGTADMRRAWYPVALRSDFPPGPSATPYATHLLGDPIVIYRDGEGVIVCLEDKCAHRSMPLSLGRIINGELECKYDGWRYNSEGAVTYIPALLPDRKIPSNAFVKRYPTVEKDDLIWVSVGRRPLPPSLRALLPSPTHLLPGPGMFSRAGREATAKAEEEEIEDVDGTRPWGKTFTQVVDLDVDHSIVIENLLDVAHVRFVRKEDRGFHEWMLMRFGGKRCPSRMMALTGTVQHLCMWKSVSREMGLRCLGV